MRTFVTLVASFALAQAHVAPVDEWDIKAAAGLLPHREPLAPIYDCGVCQLLSWGESCHKLRACGKFSEAALQPGGCVKEGICTESNKQGPLLVDDFPDLNLRVAKGMASRDYGTVRVSVVTMSEARPAMSAGVNLSYSHAFKNAWTNHYLHSGLVEVTPGKETPIAVVAGKTLSVNLPVAGAGVAGLLIADPCINQTNLITLVSCVHGRALHTDRTIPELISAFASDKSTDYWGILGDNFYDHSGSLSNRVFSKIDPEALTKIQLAVPGNHDYWILGGPEFGNHWDQCANGFMQYYGQDTFASKHLPVGSDVSPYNTSVNPKKGHLLFGCGSPTPDNFFFYNQVGNVGFLGQSGAYSWAETEHYVAEACQAFAATPTVDVVVLLGHWDISELGSEKGMDMPSFYDKVRTVKGCESFDKVGMLKFFMGHTHCNQPHPRGKVGEGFRVAGFGMSGCGNFGAPMLDTTNGRFRMVYFELEDPKVFAEAIACVKSTGWRSKECAKHSSVWLDEPLVKRLELQADLVV